MITKPQYKNVSSESVYGFLCICVLIFLLIGVPYLLFKQVEFEKYPHEFKKSEIVCRITSTDKVQIIRNSDRFEGYDVRLPNGTLQYMLPYELKRCED